MLKFVAFACVLLGVARVMGDAPKYTDTIATRSTQAEGILRCGDKPAKNVHVRLFRGASDDLSDVLASAITDERGHFKVEGDTGSYQGTEANIDPHLKIYHKCDEEESKKGFRRVILRYPREFVTLGRVPRRSYNIGTFNLQVKYPKEARVNELQGVTS